MPAPFTLRRLWTCEAELRCPFNEDRNVIPDRAVVKQLVFFCHDLLYGGSWPIGETFGQTIYDCHECPGFGFFGHPRSFGQTRRRVNDKQAGTSDGFSSTANRSNRYGDPVSCGRFYTLLSLDNAFSMAYRTDERGPIRRGKAQVLRYAGQSVDRFQVADGSTAPRTPANARRRYTLPE